MSAFQRTTLDNGITIVSEDHPSSRAVSVGIWIETGSRDEKPNQLGLSHFIEHMVFKGTKKRDSYAIVRDMEQVGAEINAFTTKEHTCYHTLGLYGDMDLAVDVLSDLVCQAKFPIDQLEVEKGVVIQEIGSSEDSPEELVYDLFLEKFYAKSALGHQILGTEESVQSFTKKDLLNYYKGRYVGSKIVVAAAGRLNHETLVKKIKKKMGRVQVGRKSAPHKKVKVECFREVFQRDSEQSHILMGFPATSFKDKQRFEAFVLNALLGGGMTSKLYQRVREDEGLAYAVYSSLSTFTDTGLINIYAHTSSDQAQKVVRIIQDELKRIKKEGLADSDLSLFKNQVRAGILLGADDMENRMNSLGVNEIVFREYRPVDQVVEEIEAVTLKSMKEYIRKYLDLDKMSLLIMGPHKSKKDQKWVETFGG
ncbi:MAG: M16 family metallopeptidase [Bdellovibrionales bacterium]